MPLIHTEFVVDVVLHQYENNSIQQLKRALRERSIKKNMSKHIYIIDSGFALRVFLEFYRGERKNRYKLLKHSMQAMRQINFKNFKKFILSNYPKSSDLEIATLFRESSAYGQIRSDGVNIETFFTAASERGFFIKHLNLLSQYKQPKFDKEELLYDQSNLEYINFMQAYEKLYHNRTRIREAFIDFGNESLMKEFYDFVENGAEHSFRAFKWREKNFP